MNEINPVSQQNSQETDIPPETTFYGHLIERPRIFTDGDGSGIVGFTAAIVENGELHRRHVVARGKDLVNYAQSYLKAGKEIIITGDYYVHRRMKGSGKLKTERRIRASNFQIR